MLGGYLADSPRAVAAIERLLPGAGGYEGAAPSLPLDHVAFRTFGAPGLGIDALGAALASFGYARQPGAAALDGGRVTAAWFALPRAEQGLLPRVCVSQLELDSLSPEARAAALRYTAPLAVAFEPTAAWAAALTRALPWGPVALDDFCVLGADSEYASWVLTNGFSLAHVALSCPEEHGGLEAALGRLRSRGFALNEARASDAAARTASDAAVRASDDGLLFQAATVADLLEFWFGGEAEPRLVPGSYLKLVERRRAPGAPAARDGFDAAAAEAFLRSTVLAAEEAAALGAAEAEAES